MNIKDRLEMAKKIINNKPTDESISCEECPLDIDNTGTDDSECSDFNKKGVVLRCRDAVVAFYVKNVDKDVEAVSDKELPNSEYTSTPEVVQKTNKDNQVALKLSDVVSMSDAVRIDSVSSELSTATINVFEQYEHLGQFVYKEELTIGTLLRIDNAFYRIVSHNTVAQVCFVVKSNYGCNYGNSVDGLNEITCPLCLHEICGSDDISEGECIICSDCGAVLEFQRTVKYDTYVTESPKVQVLE